MRFSSVWFGLSAILAGVVMSLPAQGQDPNPPSISGNGAWRMTRQWTPAETRHFAKWLEHLYVAKLNGDADQRMAKIDFILKDPRMNLLLDPAFLGEGTNPQLPDNIIRAVHSMIDCAKLTAFLPAYYAYRRGLPWMYSFVSSNGGGDTRTAKYNIPVGDISTMNSSLYNFFVNGIAGFGSGNYRVELNRKNSERSDTLPVALDPQYLMPGCPMYLDGHCLILARVTEYGELYFLNASTTNTRDLYTYNGMNVVTGITPMGAASEENPWAECYQGLRVFRYPLAVTNKNGQVTSIRRRTDEEMKEFGFSTEQYTLLKQLRQDHNIEVDGLRPSTLHDYIRLKMKSVDRIEVLKFMEQYAKELLQAYELREEFVQDAWRDYKANGPIVFPENQSNSNIFQAHGRWETWSSPSSDVDRRNKYFYLSEWVDYAIRWYGLAPEFIDLTGLESHQIRSQKDLLDAIIKEKRRIFDENVMFYTNSRGEKVKLSLMDIEQRLYDLSFDPNHPPELRWGAPFGSEEMAGAPSTSTPVPSGARVPMEEAYRLQAYYRCIGQRETESSILRGMLTSGFGIRSKFEDQLNAVWRYSTEPTDEIKEYLAKNGMSYPAYPENERASGTSRRPQGLVSPGSLLRDTTPSEAQAAPKQERTPKAEREERRLSRRDERFGRPLRTRR